MQKVLNLLEYALKSVPRNLANWSM